jgi:TRAP-type C4-dicarboxylate transport system permease small subunit
MIQQILIGLLGIAVGILMVVYARKVVENVGTSATAERYLGGGGSYTALRIGGILLTIIFFLYMTGMLSRVLTSIGRAVFGG